MRVSDDFLGVRRLESVARHDVTTYVREIAASLPAKTRVLDAGAGECAYKPLFAKCEYKSLDLAIGEARWNYEHLDYVAPLDEMPIPDESFDVVLCTEVLEHLKNPLASVQEMFRVLKPDGRLFVTVPMAQNEHQVPYDFFRYTSFGIKYLCHEAGFQTVDVAPFGGLFARWAFELPRALNVFPSLGIARGSFRPTIKSCVAVVPKATCHLAIRLIQRLLLWLDRFDKARDDPWGWCAVASKGRG
jgi:SAM-dependent methyltransferase